MIIAGPCSAESREQILSIARSLSSLGRGVILRAGLWKPRTHPGCFEGVGSEGLQWLLEARDRYGIAVCTEVLSSADAILCRSAGLDMVWIGARSVSSPQVVQEIADALEGSSMQVFVKNPIGQDLGLWSGAVERLQRSGVKNVGLIYRGFASLQSDIYRNDPHWSAVLQMRSLFPDLPMLCDPSHMGGKAQYVASLAQNALDLGLDGLMVEVHPDPQSALSDSSQQLTPEQFAAMLDGLKVRQKDASGDDYERQISILRSRIDDLDRQLLELLAGRMEVSRSIGQLKKSNNISILQTSRWDAVLQEAIARGTALGLDPAFVREVWNALHSASVAAQE